jgi:hypothetical protein
MAPRDSAGKIPFINFIGNPEVLGIWDQEMKIWDVFDKKTWKSALRAEISAEALEKLDHLPSHINEKILFSFLYCLLQVPQKDQADFIDQALQLMIPESDYYNVWVLNAFIKFTDSPRQQFVKVVLQLTTPKMDGFSRSQILAALAGLPASERQQFAQLALQLITPEMEGYYYYRIVKALTKVQAPERQQFVHLVLQLLPSEIKDYERTDFIEALAKFPVGEQQQIIEQAKRLAPYGLSLFDFNVSYSFGRMKDSTEWKQFIDQALQLFSKNAFYNSSILFRLSSMNSSDRQLFVEQVLRIGVPEYGSVEYSSSVGTLAGISATERQKVIEQTLQLIIPELTAFSHWQITDNLLKIPADERQQFVEQAFRLAIKGFCRTKSIQMLTKVPVSIRQKFVDQVLRLITPTMEQYHSYFIAGIIFYLPEAERQQFIDQVLPLFNPGMDWYNVAVVKTISDIKDDRKRQEVINQVLRLMASPAIQRLEGDHFSQQLDLAEGSRAWFPPPGAEEAWAKRINLIWSITRVRVDFLSRFADFLIQNRVTNVSHIDALSRVYNPEDWRLTLEGMRGHHDTPIPGVRAQTVHDAIFEASVSEAVGKLADRYRSIPYQRLNDLVALYGKKIDDLVKKRLLTPVEGKVAQFFFTGVNVRPDGESSETIALYLNLVWDALNDKAIAKELGRPNEFTDQDIDERVASWLKASPIDAQLAYHLDNIGTRYRGIIYHTKQELLEAIEKDESLLTTGQSCVGGSINRLISGLDLVHPDVELALGEGQQVNIGIMARYRFIQNTALAFLKKTYQETPELFSDPTTLKDTTQQHLKEAFQQEIEKNYPTLAKEEAERELNRFLDTHFDEAVQQATPLKPVYDYINDEETGLPHDLQAWLQSHQGQSLATLSGGVEQQATTLIDQKLDAITPPPSAEERAEAHQEATRAAKRTAFRDRCRIYEQLALQVMPEVPSVSVDDKTTKASQVKRTLVTLVLRELSSRDLHSEKYKQEIEGSVLDNDEVRVAFERKLPVS